MKTNATRQQYQTEFVHSDLYDAREPYQEWRFVVNFNARYCKEGDGSESVEVDDLEIELLEATAWCGGWGTLVMASGTDYAAKVERWIRRKLDNPKDGLRESVIAKCQRYFEEHGA